MQANNREHGAVEGTCHRHWEAQLSINFTVGVSVRVEDLAIRPILASVSACVAYLPSSEGGSCKSDKALWE